MNTLTKIRVVLPAHLRTLARVNGEVIVELDAPITIAGVLDQLETRFPTLRGTMRDHTTKKRRDFVRFFACREDLSNDPTDLPLPQAVCDAQEPLRIVGAMAGG
jgi:sulfur-carrier protein